MHADLSVAAFGKSPAAYGYIDENGYFVRKWFALKMEITDKMVKNGRLSVNLDEILAEIIDQHHFEKIVFSHEKN